MKSSSAHLILAAALFLLSACGPPAKSVEPVAADSSLAQSATAVHRPPPDRARVIIISGQTTRTIATMYSSSTYTVLHDMAGNIYVNDTKIGTLNGREAMVFDVAPGAYSFSWIPFKEGPEYLKRAEPSVHNLNGGALLVIGTWYDSGLIVDKRYLMHRVSTDVRDHGSSAKNADAARLAIAPGTLIVRPSSCPPTLCR
jgi:hypothetical protein